MSLSFSYVAVVRGSAWEKRALSPLRALPTSSSRRCRCFFFVLASHTIHPYKRPSWCWFRSRAPMGAGCYSSIGESAVPVPWGTFQVGCVLPRGGSVRCGVNDDVNARDPNRRAGSCRIQTYHCTTPHRRRRCGAGCAGPTLRLVVASVVAVVIVIIIIIVVVVVVVAALRRLLSSLLCGLGGRGGTLVHDR